MISSGIYNKTLTIVYTYQNINKFWTEIYVLISCSKCVPYLVNSKWQCSLELPWYVVAEYTSCYVCTCEIYQWHWLLFDFICVHVVQPRNYVKKLLRVERTWSAKHQNNYLWASFGAVLHDFWMELDNLPKQRWIRFCNQRKWNRSSFVIVFIFHWKSLSKIMTRSEALNQT